MTESEAVLPQAEETPKKLHFEWIMPLFFKPRSTLTRVVEQTTPVWLTPLLVLTVLALAAVLIAAPIRQSQAMTQSNGAVPPNFEYMTPEEQAQFQQGMSANAGPVFIYVLPGLSALAGIWIPWVLMGSLLHLALTLMGSRGSSGSSFNLAAWASMPLALRFIVQGVYMLANHQMVAAPGLSGFVTAGDSGAMAFLVAVLGQVDLYFLWMCALVLVGVMPMTGLKRGKAWSAALVVLLLTLALLALPGFIASRFSGMGSVSTFMPF